MKLFHRWTLLFFLQIFVVVVVVWLWERQAYLLSTQGMSGHPIDSGRDELLIRLQELGAQLEALRAEKARYHQMYRRGSPFNPRPARPKKNIKPSGRQVHLRALDQPDLTMTETHLYCWSTPPYFSTAANLSITLFACPHIVNGQISGRQHDAMRSWEYLANWFGVSLLFYCGNSTDEELSVCKELAKVHGARYELTPRPMYGVPTLGPMFEHARETSDSAILVYVNSDIILLEDMVMALHATYHQMNDEFLLLGKRWLLPCEKKFPCCKPDEDQRTCGVVARGLGALSYDSWARNTRIGVCQEGKLYEACELDYFAFSRDFFARTLPEPEIRVPPFFVGRSTFDNWLAYVPVLRGGKVVDASKVVMSIHRPHDYSHIITNASLLQDNVDNQRRAVFGGDLAQKNQEYAGSGNVNRGHLQERGDSDWANYVLEPIDGRISLWKRHCPVCKNFILQARKQMRNPHVNTTVLDAFEKTKRPGKTFRDY